MGDAFKLDSISKALRVLELQSSKSKNSIRAEAYYSESSRRDEIRVENHELLIADRFQNSGNFSTSPIVKNILLQIHINAGNFSDSDSEKDIDHQKKFKIKRRALLNLLSDSEQNLQPRLLQYLNDLVGISWCLHDNNFSARALQLIIVSHLKMVLGNTDEWQVSNLNAKDGEQSDRFIIIRNVRRIIAFTINRVRQCEFRLSGFKHNIHKSKWFPECYQRCHEELMQKGERELRCLKIERDNGVQLSESIADLEKKDAKKLKLYIQQQSRASVDSEFNNIQVVLFTVIQVAHRILVRTVPLD